MNLRLPNSKTRSRQDQSNSNNKDSAAVIDIGLTSGELRRCAQLFDEYNRPECAMFFVELLVTPSTKRAEKIMYSSQIRQTTQLLDLEKVNEQRRV